MNRNVIFRTNDDFPFKYYTAQSCRTNTKYRRPIIICPKLLKLSLISIDYIQTECHVCMYNQVLQLFLLCYNNVK